VSHGPTGWNPINTPWSWTIASATTAVVGFDPSKFVLDVTDFIDDHPTAEYNLFQLEQSGNTVRIVYVPEPGAITILGGAAFGLLRRGRRRC
jgi:hypothetical protein